ncbi:hypothetical protein OH491_27090 [Termitidicoccus mucosus]|uniref:Uncharacterized protein n=1 Tax=Termitidicoccus mucosus TaxID=1184151 RepID=A0A178IBX3_9BACT|nr:hypothetical protein AW736_23670 [Opitutaceae bacterium TSB47]
MTSSSLFANDLTNSQDNVLSSPDTEGRATESNPYDTWSDQNRPASFESLPGCFITSAGEIQTPVALYEEETPTPDGAMLPGFRRLSHTAAVDLVRETMRKSGQMLIRSPDGQACLWFSGIGDPERLFVEVQPRAAEPFDVINGGVCRFESAARLVQCIYDGASAPELESCLRRETCLPNAALVCSAASASLNALK